MRKRYRSSKTETELFPFLSVLACTIGALILLIIVMTTETLGNNPEITIIAKNEFGMNQKKQPRYIECQENGVLIHPSEVFVPLAEMEQPDSPLQKLMIEVKEKQDQEYVIVAVRPSGIEVFQKVRELIETQGIDIGYEPIEEDWKLKIKK
jgi:hypothetical protein